MSDSSVQLRQILNDCVAQQTLRQVVLSRPRQTSQDVRRIDVRPVRLRAGVRFQFASQTATQEFHRNEEPGSTADEIWKLISADFRDLRIVTVTETWEARFSRKNECSLRRVHVTPEPASRSSASADDAAAEQDLSHNRQRAYLIPDGVPCPFLIRTGIMSASGQVYAKHFHKFRQINRYAEFIRDIVPELPATGTIRVVDFGCGKSYLTFATHYLLTHCLGRDCEITGLDQRADVVATCRRITEDLCLPGLRFEMGQISEYEPQSPVHLSISLHACNTATDDAMFKAIQWKTPVIMAVPCCQHELASILAPEVSPVLTASGILKERFASLATDAIRAAVLRAIGYDASIMEFIETEHTPKNLLIRAVRRQSTDGVQEKDLRQLEEFRHELKTGPLCLERRLRENGMLPR